MENIVKQINSPNGRSYSTPSGVFPSVTTILYKTKSERDKQSLEDWRNRIGPAEADKISLSSRLDGTLMHNCIEGLLSWDDNALDMNRVGIKIAEDTSGADKNRVSKFVQSWNMHVLPRIGQTYFIEKFGWNEKHGYAGAIDYGGEFDGISSVIDWKNSLKVKKDSYLTDYKLQGSAYIGMVYRCPVFKDVPQIKQFVSVIMNDETDEPQVVIVPLKDILSTWFPMWELRCKAFHRMNSLNA